jgi:hypothetical protein
MNGTCVAGVSEDDEWFRPLGSGDGGAVLRNERTLDSGSEPLLLDQIVVSLKAPVPDQYQPENWTVKNATWRFVRHFDIDSARPLLVRLRTRQPELFRNRTDRISQAELDADPATASLTIVCPADFRLYYRRNWWNGGRRIRAEFVQAGQQYDLAMTDPAFKDLVGELPDDERVKAEDLFPNTSFFLTISLGEPWKGDCYKMVAGVIGLAR